MSPRLLSPLTPGDLIQVIGQYAAEVASGRNLSAMDNLSDDTIMGYINAAAAWIQCQTGQAVPLYSNEGGSRPDRKLHPMLSSLLADRRKWTKKRELRLPISGLMMNAMHAMVSEDYCTSGDSSNLSRNAALYDWICLGLFTGHRLGEFGQSVLPQGSRALSFDPLPTNKHIPRSWRGKPKAFVRDDFTFYDKNLNLVDHHALVRHPRLAEYVHIRWRYDKSKFNFIVKQYQRQHGTSLCPVKRATNIMVRAMQLHLPLDTEPLGMFVGANRQTYTIRGSHVKAFLQEACRRAYPDPKNYFRRNIQLFQAHSIRITACVALDNAGVAHEDIAFRLRWNSDAIKGYLRDCFRHVGELTARTVAGICSTADTTAPAIQLRG
jgi:hypothetical protein